MRTCTRTVQLRALHTFRPFTAAVPRAHLRAGTVASFAANRRRFGSGVLLAGLAMFGGQGRGMAALAAQQSVEKVWPVYVNHC